MLRGGGPNDYPWSMADYLSVVLFCLILLPFVPLLYLYLAVRHNLDYGRWA